MKWFIVFGSHSNRIYFKLIDMFFCVYSQLRYIELNSRTLSIYIYRCNLPMMLCFNPFFESWKKVGISESVEGPAFFVGWTHGHTKLNDPAGAYFKLLPNLDPLGLDIFFQLNINKSLRIQVKSINHISLIHES